MTLSKAVNLFKEKFPEYTVVGYWEKPNGFVLNAKAPDSKAGIITPGQFMVTSSGDVYGTNPVLSDLNLSLMRDV